jgi:hypothetical protein
MAAIVMNFVKDAWNARLGNVGKEDFSVVLLQDTFSIKGIVKGGSVEVTLTGFRQVRRWGAMANIDVDMTERGRFEIGRFLRLFHSWEGGDGEDIDFC